MKTLRGVDYTILLSLTETLHENRLCQKCRNFVKNNFLACQKSHAHLQYAYNICEKFQMDCLKTLGGDDYTNLLLHIEAKSENCLSPKCRHYVKRDFLLAKSHMHIIIMLITSVQSFKLIARKPWEELIT